MTPSPAAEMRGITKRFPRVTANDGVDLTLQKGEIHAVVGENGAGKSTLMKILYGMLRPDAGTMRLDGREVRFGSPAEAIAAGIGMVHQHFMLVPPLTVSENVVLGQEPVGRGGLLDRRAAEARTAELSARYGLNVDPRARVRDLSVGLEQRVEILKVLYRGARIMILDEPTAVLTPQEVEELLATLRSLREAGTTIVLITHKLREVQAVADRVTVMRQGRSVETLPMNGVSIDELSELMIGRKPAPPPPAEPPDEGAKVRLALENVSARSDRGLPALRGVSLRVRAGEIVGVAGVEGNGQTELEEVLAGLRRPDEGRVLFDGADVTRSAPLQRLELGFSHVPSDRLRDALLLDAPIYENFLLGHHRDPAFGRPWKLDRAALLERTRAGMEAFDVRPRDVLQSARALSGGNQQKVVIARETARAVRVLVAAHPTRGVDLGASEFIYGKLREARRGGAAVVLVSSELSELMLLSDRIVVLFGGRIVGEVRGADATEQKLGRWMTGAA